jgi:hypothetical protein
LAQPKERRPKERSQQDDPAEVKQKSGRVFQGC